MRTSRRILALWVLYLLASILSAQAGSSNGGMEIDRMDLLFDIGGDMVVKETMNLSLTAKVDVEQFSMVAYGQVSDLRVIGSIPLESDLIPGRYGSNRIVVRFGKALEAGEEANLSIFFTAEGYVVRVRDEFRFTFSYKPGFSHRDMVCTVALPPSGFVPQTPFESSSQRPVKRLIPEDVETTTDGERIYLTWTKRSIGTKEVYFVVQYAMGTMPNDGGAGMHIHSIGFAALVAVVGLSSVVYLEAKKRIWKKAGPSKLRTGKPSLPLSGSALSLLKPDERRLVEAVIKSPGMTQKQLCELLEMSAYKVSVLSSQLADRGLLRKTPWGRSHRLYPAEGLDSEREANSS